MTKGEKKGTTKYELRVPNYEIKLVFQNIIVDWFEIEIKLIKTQLEDTAEHLVNNRLDKFASGFKKIIGEIMDANKRLFAFDNVENIIKIAIVFVGKVAYF